MGGTERIRDCLRHRLRGAEAPPTPKWEGLMSCKVGPARPSPPAPHPTTLRSFGHIPVPRPPFVGQAVAPHDHV